MGLDRPEAQDPYQKLPQVAGFELTSSDLTDRAPMAEQFAYDGAADTAQNVSPQLSWSGFPTETKSFVVTCFDPDAPTPSGFWHWVLVDLPANVRSLETGAGANGADLPGSAFHVRCDWGNKGYGGAYPPDNDRPHRYYFVAHALDVATLGVDDETSAAVVSFTMLFHTLARAELVATFRR